MVRNPSFVVYSIKDVRPLNVSHFFSYNRTIRVYATQVSRLCVPKKWMIPLPLPAGLLLYDFNFEMDSFWIWTSHTNTPSPTYPTHCRLFKFCLRSFITSFFGPPGLLQYSDHIDSDSWLFLSPFSHSVFTVSPRYFFRRLSWISLGSLLDTLVYSDTFSTVTEPFPTSVTSFSPYLFSP